jgi:signal transduction histidine kinase
MNQCIREIPTNLRRLTHDAEITMFRVVQEGLTNIHRHSGSDTARIRLQTQDNLFTLEVKDHGKGMPEEKVRSFARSGRVGVGFSGMRERLRQLGGTLEIQSDQDGTLVKAVLPIDDSISRAS